MSTPRRLGLLLAALTLLALCAPGAGAAPGAKPGATVGWVRLAHLSPKVGPVDIYFARFGEQEKVVIRKAGYGAMTPYSSLPPGAYTVSMRPADAPATTAPALTATVQVNPATAYSLLVFATGPDGALRGDLVTDDLASPAAGTGRVRVVQGSAAPSPVSATVDGGRALATDVAYGVTTPYVQVPAGSIAVRLSGTGVDSKSTVDVKPGAVSTLLLTEQSGGLAVTEVADSTGVAAAPMLGVQTGGGGAVHPLPPPGLPWWQFVVAGALAAGGVLWWRRRTGAA